MCASPREGHHIPEDKLAESCENYAEYVMKCELRGIKPPLGETEFKIYKY